MLFQAAFEERPVRDLAEIFRDKPDVFFCGHPVEVIKPSQVYWPRITPERALAAQVEVDIKIAQCQLAQSAVDRVPIAAPAEIGFGDSAPMSARFENRDHMVRVMIRFEIKNERGKSEDAKGRRGE